MKRTCRIVRYVVLALILIFVLSGLKASSFTCYAETKVRGKEYYMELAKSLPIEALKDIVDYKDQPWAPEIIETIAENRPYAVLMYADLYKDQPWAEKIVKTLVENSYADGLRFADRYVDQPWAREIIENLAENYPTAALIYADRYINQPWAQEIIESAAERRPEAALRNAGSYKGQTYGSSVLKKAVDFLVENEPWLVLWYGDRHMDQAWMQKAIEKAAENDPRAAHRIFWREELKRILQKSEKESIKTILAIREHYDPHVSPGRIEERMLIILEEIVAKNLTLREAAKIVNGDKEFFKILVCIKSKPNHLGKVCVELQLKHQSLIKVKEINDLHDEPDALRFQSVKDANPQEIYTLMVYGKEEIFTSSFNGLFDRLLRAMGREEIGGDRLLEDLGYNKFRSFIKLCTGFNRLNEFLETMEKDLQKSLLRKFVRGIDKEKNALEEAVVIADTFSMVEDKEILKVLQETIKIEYERVKLEESREGKILYGLLAGMFGEKPVINEAWIQEMAKKYKLPDLTKIPSKELFNRSGLNIQQYFFYDDKDGRASFQSFLSQYRGKRGWKIEDKTSFVCIKSVKKDRGVEIYANKPEAEKNGPRDIAKLLEKKNVQPTVVVHRGHSYHVPKTIKRIPSGVKIVSLGSCGGYNNISLVLGRASEAHIISTKARGTMLVNDPLLKMLNEEILSGRDIHWPGFWQKAEKRLGRIRDFRNYISPHKNLGALFLKAYRRLLESEP